MPWDALGDHAKNIPQKGLWNYFPGGQNPSKTYNCHQFSHAAKPRDRIAKHSCADGGGGLPTLGIPPSLWDTCGRSLGTFG